MVWFGWYCIIGFVIVVLTRKTVMQEVMDEVYEQLPPGVDYAVLYMMGACLITLGWLPFLIYICWLVWRHEDDDEVNEE
ncbi:hypothetical protein COC69_01270 [Bacillus cereus]|uniref:Uncharacterized protein n=1 Tax=Bacillus cereus TaxID=1396 RepID=A0A9X7CSD1_BACCE|nr:hypothetical protein [Bacillus cereus]PGS83971.1 hypothetical protein COC69_01270 [Bacillus cereus]